MKKIVIAMLFVFGLTGASHAGEPKPIEAKEEKNWIETRTASLCEAGQNLTIMVSKIAQEAAGPTGKQNVRMTGCYLVGPIAGRVNIVSTVATETEMFTLETGYLLGFDDKKQEWRMIKSGVILMLNLKTNEFTFSVTE